MGDMLSQIIIYILLHVQADKRVLVTDEWLRVKGCEDVYAIGDCASITQRKIMVCKTCTSFIFIIRISVSAGSLDLLWCGMLEQLLEVKIFCIFSVCFLYLK